MKELTRKKLTFLENEELHVGMLERSKAVSPDIAVMMLLDALVTVEASMEEIGRDEEKVKKFYGTPANNKDWKEMVDRLVPISNERTTREQLAYLRFSHAMVHAALELGADHPATKEAERRVKEHTASLKDRMEKAKDWERWMASVASKDEKPSSIPDISEWFRAKIERDLEDYDKPEKN